LPTDSLFAPITTTDELLESTGDRAWVQAMLDSEVALARAEAEAGLVPVAASDAISACCQSSRFDPVELGRAARAGGNPVIPMVQALTSMVAPEGGPWVHWGATSQDILDTAAMLVAQRATKLIVADLARLADGCDTLAETHRRTVMVGRTLLQPALPITFGFKAAGWLVAVTDCRYELRNAVSGLAAQLGGAAGTLAALGERGTEVAATYARLLGLPEPVVPWHTARQRTARLAGALAMVAGTAAKVSGDVALLMQAELSEVSEPAGPGRGGSSTLPHKRNPIGAAEVGSAARRAVALLPVFFGGVAAELERSLSAWPAELHSLTELLRLSGGAAARTADIVEGLEVHAANMAANVDRSAGSLMAERLSLALAPHLGRSTAHETVATAARRAGSGSREDTTAALLADPAVAGVMSAADIRALLEPESYLGVSDSWIDRARAYHRQFPAL
jgi:3-carboxy-cis,cis-muconate cycloisomerase